MELLERIRAALHDCEFHPPATEDDIALVERELNLTLSSELTRAVPALRRILLGEEPGPDAAADGFTPRDFFRTNPC